MQFSFLSVHQPPPLLLISVSLALPPNSSLVISSSLPNLHFEETPKSSFPILSRNHDIPSSTLTNAANGSLSRPMPSACAVPTKSLARWR
ncbi:hypothetical protein ES319_D08G007200v1 [Gossypium barbadense]|uniref:Uncharacterized protein n=1 Tax=Gossypium barbadense TaxID=3634 RepID=A0A5J5Q7Z5_GOSBA|nr:hypothetical protein ES319_D08G007200v1 [Gossypium barbadense]